MVKSVATVCSEIYDEVRKLADDMRGHALVLRVNPDVARALQGEEASVLRDLGTLVDARVVVQGDPLLHQEQFDLVARLLDHGAGAPPPVAASPRAPE
jgi:ribonuclease G